jgi:SAM-dependent methyltransferase
MEKTGEMVETTERISADLSSKEYVYCNLCGADSTRLWGRKQGFDIVECRECGLVYVNPRLLGEKMKQHYDAQYFIDDDYDGDQARGEMYEIEIRDMIKIVGHRGRFLDVGCAQGRFLSCLPDTLEKYGVELSPESSSYGREKYGFDIREGELHQIPFGDNFFDIVQYRGVFEHLEDPGRDLEVCHRIIKNNGWLILSTIPNIDGPCGRFYREKFKLIDPGPHIYYFSRRTLKRYCEKSGFVIRHIFYPYLGTPYENLGADILHFVTDLLRDHESPPFFRSVITVFAQKHRGTRDLVGEIRECDRS